MKMIYKGNNQTQQLVAMNYSHAAEQQSHIFVIQSEFPEILIKIMHFECL